MKGHHLQKIAKVLAILIAAAVSYAVLTTPKGEFKPTSDVDEMRRRLEKRVGVAEKETKKAVKKAERAATGGTRKKSTKASSKKKKKGGVVEKYKKSMDQL